MDGDFFLVRRLIEQFDISWMQTLEAIFETLENHEMLQEPVPEFARLAPYKDESYLDYAWRVRNGFFNLPMHIRGSDIVRGKAIKNLKTYMPSVWSQIRENQRQMSTSELMDRAVRQTEHITHYEIEKYIYKTSPESVVLQHNSQSYYRQRSEPMTKNATGGNPRLTIVDPTTDDQLIATTSERAYVEKTMSCYSCGKARHISPNCPIKKRENTPNIRPAVEQQHKGQKVTIKGTLFRENSRVGNLIRTAGKRLWEGKTSQGRKVYFVASNKEDEDINNSPVDRIDRDGDVDWEIDQLENEILEHTED